MDADKQKALEAAGWQVGSADDFLAGAPMDTDKMRAEFEKWADYNEYRVCRDNERYDRIETNMVWRAWQAAYAAGRKAEREDIWIEWEGAEALTAEVERLRAELAAAKAASKCPVKLFWCYESNGCDIVISGMSDEDSTKFGNWLNQRIKDTTPPTT